SNISSMLFLPATMIRCSLEHCASTIMGSRTRRHSPVRWGWSTIVTNQYANWVLELPELRALSIKARSRLNVCTSTYKSQWISWRLSKDLKKNQKKVRFIDGKI